jgi:predicted RNA-binding protein with PUA-like domain
MARRRWLLKSDPESFGWPDLEHAKGRRAVWDGVRNYQARNYLRDEVKRGDGVLFYHSGSDKAVVGTCTVTRAAFPDPTDEAWTAIEIALEARFAAPVTLDAMRAVPGLAKMVLLKRGSRLSVQPVSEEEWEIVLRLGRG